MLCLQAKLWTDLRVHFLDLLNLFLQPKSCFFLMVKFFLKFWDVSPWGGPGSLRSDGSCEHRPWLIWYLRPLSLGNLGSLFISEFWILFINHSSLNRVAVFIILNSLLVKLSHFFFSIQLIESLKSSSSKLALSIRLNFVLVIFKVNLILFYNSSLLLVRTLGSAAHTYVATSWLSAHVRRSSSAMSWHNFIMHSSLLRQLLIEATEPLSLLSQWFISLLNMLDILFRLIHSNSRANGAHWTRCGLRPFLLAPCNIRASMSWASFISIDGQAWRISDRRVSYLSFSTESVSLLVEKLLRLA